jgi:hypothetical protein
MPTQLAYREGLSYSFDDLEIFAASGGDTSSFASASLVNADANASTATYNDRWVFNATQVFQRKTRTNIYTLGTGSLGIAPIWTAPNSSDRIELTRLFPSFEPGPYTASQSWRRIVNRALQMIVVPDQITIAIVPGQQAYSLATWQKWLDREERFGWPPLPDGTPQPRMWEPSPTGGSPTPADWRRPHLRLDADVPFVEIDVPFVAGTTGSMVLNVMRPANTWVRVSGTWGESANDGLVGDTDEARPSVEAVVKVGRWIAIQTLAARGVTDATGRWSDKIADARAEAMGVKYFDRTQMATLVPPPAAPPGAA